VAESLVSRCWQLKYKYEYENEIYVEIQIQMLAVDWANLSEMTFLGFSAEVKEVMRLCKK